MRTILIATALLIASSSHAEEVKTTTGTDAVSVCMRVQESQGKPGLLTLAADGWSGFHIDALGPTLQVDGAERTPTKADVQRNADETVQAVVYSFDGLGTLTLRFSATDGVVLMDSSFRNASGKPLVLNQVRLLATSPGETGTSFGSSAAAVRVFEQGTHWGHVVPLTVNDAATTTRAEAMGQADPIRNSSDFISVVYDRGAKLAFLAGFETSERWIGQIGVAAQPDGTGQSWQIRFDAGDLLVDPGATVPFESVRFAAGSDPWRLLEDYAEAAARRHPVSLPDETPVTWCSWYPYRLGVTEDRVLETARIAAERLKPLGLRTLQIDLGWQSKQLPNTLDENSQFPHGLKWLSEQLQSFGLSLGVWSAPFTISEYSPIVREHPEWLIKNESGELATLGEWFWKPHGKTCIPDLTHPGTQEFLRKGIASLHERGVRYLKADFISAVSGSVAKNRHDKRIVAGGGVEAARIAARIIREAMPDSLILNCGGPEMPGTGAWPLLYSCADTGNSGFLSAAFEMKNFQAVACHLFKNRRWGILQPSCLCVGLPGTVEDARIRATVAFLTGGEVDLGDTLVSLPEERWHILTATLPPLGIAAKPVDLFEPVTGPLKYDYSGTCANGQKEPEAVKEYPPGSVWRLHVKADWDEWDLVGVFCYESKIVGQEATISRYRIPLKQLGLPEEPKWMYEFWSQQFVGSVPAKRPNPNGYEHPGDLQDLSVGNAPGTLDIAFFGPTVKLLCLRTPRPHPWVVGSSFHQSCGAELHHVAWDEASKTLSGKVQRPTGEIGRVLVSDGGRPIVSAEVDGRKVTALRAANGAWSVPVTVSNSPCPWSVQFQK